MAGQERITPSNDQRDELEPADSPQSGTQGSASDLDAQVDSILDEIDSLLEENAEDFVKSFVQKGGQ